MTKRTLPFQVSIVFSARTRELKVNGERC